MSGRDPSPAPPGATGAPYRTPGEMDPRRRRSRELEYLPRKAGGHDGLLVLYRLFSLPFMVATAAASVAGSAGGVAGLLGAGAYSVWSWRARKRGGGAILRVEGDLLIVAVRGDASLTESFRLSDLANVALDVKTITRVIDDAGPVPGARLIGPRVATKVDIARIVLVEGGGREVLLTEEYVAHLEATDWLGKIRVFLRKHGWVPEDERDAPPGADEA